MCAHSAEAHGLAVGLGSTGLMVGLNDLTGLFQLK